MRGAGGDAMAEPDCGSVLGDDDHVAELAGRRAPGARRPGASIPSSLVRRNRIPSGGRAGAECAHESRKLWVGRKHCATVFIRR